MSHMGSENQASTVGPVEGDGTGAFGRFGRDRYRKMPHKKMPRYREG